MKTAPATTETEWQAKVVETATWNGWWHHHHHDARRSTPGLPDLILVRPPRVIFAELKTDAGVVTDEQRRVLDMLRDCHGVEAYLWRPGDFGFVAEVLARRGAVNADRRIAAAEALTWRPT